MTKILKPDTVEEYERLLVAAADHQIVVQELGDYTLIVPEEWKPPRAPRSTATAAKAEAEAEPEPESKTSRSARSSKEAG